MRLDQEVGARNPSAIASETLRERHLSARSSRRFIDSTDRKMVSELPQAPAVLWHEGHDAREALCCTKHEVARYVVAEPAGPRTVVMRLPASHHRVHEPARLDALLSSDLFQGDPVEAFHRDSRIFACQGEGPLLPMMCSPRSASLGPFLIQHREVFAFPRKCR
jgi:hypothetical protein